MPDNYERIYKALERLDGKIDDNARTQNDNMGVVVTVVSKIELLLEKVANTNDRLVAETDGRKDGDNRLHNRIDGIDADIVGLKNTQDTSGCPAMERVISKYNIVVSESKLDRERTRNRLNKVEEDIATINDKPAKRWERMTTVAITTITALLIAYIATQVGLK